MLVCVRSFVRKIIVRTITRLCNDRSGTITTTFALTMIPVMSAVGAAVDYSRANSIKTSMQMALDSAVLAGGKDGSSNWAQIATNVFNANIVSRGATSLSFSTAF